MPPRSPWSGSRRPVGLDFLKLRHLRSLWEAPGETSRPYASECVEGQSCELRAEGVLGSRYGQEGTPRRVVQAEVLHFAGGLPGIMGRPSYGAGEPGDRVGCAAR